eukprot:scaffold53298_cov28-Phaeocystis_antarctica.AAC.1
MLPRGLLGFDTLALLSHPCQRQQLLPSSSTSRSPLSPCVAPCSSASSAVSKTLLQPLAGHAKPSPPGAMVALAPRLCTFFLRACHTRERHSAMRAPRRPLALL